MTLTCIHVRLCIVGVIATHDQTNETELSLPCKQVSTTPASIESEHIDYESRT
mgnify:FL=1